MKSMNLLGLSSVLIVVFILILFVCSCDDSVNETSRYAEEFTSVQLDTASEAPLQLAVQSCAGLYNRELGGSLYVVKDNHDEFWLNELQLIPSRVLTATDFLDECIAKFSSCVLYSYEQQQELMPNILTIAAATEAIPLDVGISEACSQVVVDATLELADKNTRYLATKYVFENFIQDTTGLAMHNPGYEVWNPSSVSNPEMTDETPSHLVDFFFSEKLFVVFLVNGCLDGDPEKDLLQDIVNAGYWSTPLGVYGYNSSWMVAGGFLHEAQTKCLDSRNMGAIPTSIANLSFFSSRRPSIIKANQLAQNSPEDITYDPNKTYVAFVIGDGDNVRYIMTTRKDWMLQRLEMCENPDNECPPLSWSISPHLHDLAPDVLEWYYKMAHQTGKDYFILPPSGHFYAYPTSLNEEAQNRFVTETEKDARLLGIHSVVHWDWLDTWHQAEDHFLPKYANGSGDIFGVFTINVPFMFPNFDWWPDDQFFKVLTGNNGGEVAVFRPRSWRGVDNREGGLGDEALSYLSPDKMAEELDGYPPGTIAWVYMTSDGGLTLENSLMELVKILPSHVQLVSADTAARLALEKGE